MSFTLGDERMPRRRRTSTGKYDDSEGQENDASTSKLPKTEGDMSFLREALSSNEKLIPIFADVSDDALSAVIRKMFAVQLKPGQEILKKGDQLNFFYVVAEGRLGILTGKRSVKELGPGGSFGEQALHQESPSNAIVRAAEPEGATLWALSRDEMKVALEGTMREKIHSYAALLRKVEFFKDKSKEGLSKLADTIMEMTFYNGEYIFRKGDIGRAVFVLYQGDVLYTDEGDISKQIHSNSDADEVPCFGAQSLLENQPQVASVKVISESAKLLMLDSKVFLRLAHPHHSDSDEDNFGGSDDEEHLSSAKKMCEVSMRTQLLNKVELFRRLNYNIRRRLAETIEIQTYRRGDHIFHQGDVAEGCYVLVKGELSCMVDGDETGRLLCDPKSSTAPCFGSRALVRGAPRAASVQVASDQALVWFISSDVFQDVIKKGSENQVEYRLEDLNELGVLGCGAFGAVKLVRHELTGQTLALKALSKGHIVASKHEKRVMCERSVLRMANTPFVVRLAATLTSSDYIYFLLEPALGGELFALYEANPSWYGSEVHARFYVGCTLRALDYLHNRQIAYRDLKPENLLLNNDGYCKLTDLGLAKLVIGHTYTIVGTPEYFAPEILSGSGYTLAVDWWALGILIFELMTGASPFAADDQQEISRKAAQGIDFVDFPETCKDWDDLVKSMCKHDFSQRLPMRPGGVRNFEGHPWYSQTATCFEWSLLDKGLMVAPYKPNVVGNNDLVNFQNSPKVLPPVIEYIDDGSGWDAGFEERWGPSTFRWETKGAEDPEDSTAAEETAA